MRGKAVHFEILTEDLSGKIALQSIVPRLIGPDDTYKIHRYKGIGHLPKDLSVCSDPQKRVLLAQLPRLLRGYGKTFASYGPACRAALIVVCDLDRNNEQEFLAELGAVLNACHPQPNARFCLAIEEGEAWLLGDLGAVKIAYPRAKEAVLRSYANDSICGTWETLANAVYPGGSQALIRKGPHAVGTEKCRWAEKISPNMQMDENQSPSFCAFRETMTGLAEF